MMDRMARFLSEDWFALARAALSEDADEDAVADADAGADADAASSVSVRHRVTGGPDGDVDYLVRARAGRFTIEPGEGGPADIEIIETYGSAAAISQGLLTPAAAFAAGQLKLAGDVALLAERQSDFVALGRLLAPVRATTTY
jgi:hypothetical protein